MKSKFQFLITSIILYVLIFTGTFFLITGCAKDDAVTLIPLPTGWTTVAAIGKDTTYTRVMYTGGREETIVLASAENEQLKAELIQYINGTYTVKVTNKQNVPANLLWNWRNGLSIDSITPSSMDGNNKIYSLPANGIVIFTLVGDAHTGQLLLRAQSSSAGQDNSQWLSLDITASILPIKFLVCETYRKDNKLIVNFTIDNPEEIDTFEINFSESGKVGTYKVLKTVNCDHKTKVYSIEIPAYK